MSAGLKENLQRWNSLKERVKQTIADNSVLDQDGVYLVAQKLSELAGIGLQMLEVREQGKALSRCQARRFQKLLDSLEYDVFYPGHAGTTNTFVPGFLKPDALNRHNIAIQPAVRLLLESAN